MSLPQSITDYIEQRLRDTSPKRMEGWCTPEKARALAECVQAVEAKVCVEIGVFAGRSLFAMALMQKSLEAGGVTLGIDPWSPSASIAGFEFDPPNRDWWAKLDHNSIYRECEGVRKELSLDNVTLFRGTSVQAYPALVFGRELPFLDVLHIDGNHSELSAYEDVAKYAPLVKASGIIVFDDLEWSTTKAAQKKLGEIAQFTHMVGGCGFFERKTSST